MKNKKTIIVNSAPMNESDEERKDQEFQEFLQKELKEVRQELALVRKELNKVNDEYVFLPN
ncbi:MAG: hypothetical protein A2W30_09600 [Ignavibacteria bacterium RBG_16_36_9]|nr:MAG: hypothetical protein A2W30_09600 [Ignavibacteria bacterium RBG_16_36_9]